MMKITIKSLCFLCLFVAIPAGFTGCAWVHPSTVAAGSDPVVVGAEQTAKLSVAYTSEFLKWEMLNRGTITSDITRFADRVRDEFPPDYAALRAATKAYKTSRSPANKLTLDSALATLNTLLVQVLQRLPAPEAASARAVAPNINLN